MDTAALVDALQHADITTDPERDVVRAAPDLTVDEAYDLQFELLRRRAEASGDRVGGYQASFTSKAAQELIPSMPYPMVGTLLSSQLVQSGAIATLDWGRYQMYFVESEIGMLLGADLAGPGITATQARNAVGGLFAAMEVAPVRPGTFEGQWSNQHLVATHNTDSTIVIGEQGTAPTLNLRTEGLVCSVDGEVRGSATGVEAMGDPFVVLAEMTNRLGRHGQHLKAGQIVITGACVAPQRVFEASRLARVDTTRLGSVEIRLGR